MNFYLVKLQHRFDANTSSPLLFSTLDYACDGRRRLFRFTACLSLALCSFGYAQSHSIAYYGPTASHLELPVSTGVFSHVDAGALAEIVAHLKVVGATPWTGMQGTGQITYGADDPTAFSATLSIFGDSGFRLDGQTSTGPMSIRIIGNGGKIQEKDGRQFFLPVSTAASGIFQFEIPRTANFPDPRATLLDHGMVVLDGVTLHRVTYEAPITPSATVTQKTETVATDLYFDATTHLLVKSANAIRITGAGNNDFLRVITYGDYRTVDGSLVPFRYTQTLNGEKQWALQLTDVQLNSSFGDKFFQF